MPLNKILYFLNNFFSSSVSPSYEVSRNCHKSSYLSLSLHSPLKCWNLKAYFSFCCLAFQTFSFFLFCFNIVKFVSVHSVQFYFSLLWHCQQLKLSHYFSRLPVKHTFFLFLFYPFLPPGQAHDVKFMLEPKRKNMQSEIWKLAWRVKCVVWWCHTNGKWGFSFIFLFFF